MGWLRNRKFSAFLSDALVPIARIRVTAQPFGSLRSPLLFDGLEHFRQIVRVISSPSEYLRAEDIGLRLILTTKLQKIGAESNLRALRHDAAGISTNNCAKNRAAYRPCLLYTSDAADERSSV